MPLTMSENGQTSIIKKITGKDETRQHLAELGFVVGAPVTVVNVMGGNMILDIKGSRVALGKSIANRILI